MASGGLALPTGDRRVAAILASGFHEGLELRNFYTRADETVMFFNNLDVLLTAASHYIYNAELVGPASEDGLNMLVFVRFPWLLAALRPGMFWESYAFRIPRAPMRGTPPVAAAGVRTVLADTIALLRRIPHGVVERAQILPGRPVTSLPAAADFPPWLVDCYAEVGGAHIAWRLAPASYELLGPGRLDNPYRYDIFGNFDLLSPEDVASGLGIGWDVVFRQDAAGYRPVDYASSVLNVGTVSGVDGPVLIDRVHDYRIPLSLALPEYVQHGARLLFLDFWQTSLTDGEDDAQTRAEVLDRATRLAGLARQAPAGSTS